MATLPQLEQALINADKAGDSNAARTLAAFIVKARQDPTNQIPDTSVAGSQPVASEPSLADKAIGTGEAALTLSTGATTGTVGMIGGTLKGLAEQILSGQFGTPEAAQAVQQQAMQGAQALTYSPKTPSGQAQVEAVAPVLEAAGALAPLAETGMLASAAKQAAPAIATAARETAVPVIDAAKQGIQSGIQKVASIAGMGEDAAPAKTSMGAAATDPALQRIAKAESLPSKYNLTKGEASREAEQLAFEKEQMKGPAGAPLRDRAEEHNIKHLENMDALIDMTDAKTPDIAAAGNSVTKALSEGYKSSKNRTNVQYTKAFNSEGAKEPVDLSRVVKIGEGEQQVNSSLLDYINENAGDINAPGVPNAAKKAAIQLGIAKVDENGRLVPQTAAPDYSGNAPKIEATVGKIEKLRQAVNNNIGYDPKDIRQGTIIKRLIDATVGDAGGPEFQKARVYRQQQARKYENRAVVARLVQNVRGGDDPKVFADQVLKRSILTAAPEEITFLKRVLKTNGEAGRQAWKELQGATVRHMQEEATKGLGTDSAGNPLVSPAKLNQTVTALDRNGRLDIIFDKKTADTIRDLKDIVKDVNTVPPGTLVNNSGTAGTIMAAIAEAGTTGALTGIPIPALSLIKAAAKHVKNKRLEARVSEALNETKVEKK